MLLYGEVLPTGTPANITVLQPLGFGLDERAIEAAKRWQFKPGQKDGVPVTVGVTFEVNFRLRDSYTSASSVVAVYANTAAKNASLDLNPPTVIHLPVSSDEQEVV